MEQQEAQLPQQRRHGKDSLFGRRSSMNITEVSAAASLPATGSAAATPLRTASVPLFPGAAQSSSSAVGTARASSVAPSGTRSKAAAGGVRASARRITAAASPGGARSSAAASSGGGSNSLGLSFSPNQSLVDKRILLLAREVVDVDAVRRRRALKKIENFLRPLPISSVAVFPFPYLPSSSSHSSFPSVASPLPSAALSTHATARAGLAMPAAAGGSSLATSPGCVAKGRRLPLSLQQFERMWLMLFYAAWLSDKPLIQRELFVRLALLQRLLHAPEEKRRFFKAFLLVLQRQWHALDQHRLDKFLLLVRIITAELTAAIIAACRYCSAEGRVFPVCANSDRNLSSSLSGSDNQTTCSIESSSSSNSNKSRRQQTKTNKMKKEKQAGPQQPSVAMPGVGEVDAGGESHSTEKHLRKTFLFPMAKFLATELLTGSPKKQGASQGLRMQFIDCFLSEYRASTTSPVTGATLPAATPGLPVTAAPPAIGSVSASLEPGGITAGNMSSQERAAPTAEPQQQKHSASNQQQQQSLCSSGSFAADKLFLRVVLFPFLYAACYCDDPIALRAIHQRVLRQLEPSDLDFRLLLATLFALASAGGIRSKNSRLLYSTLNDLERKFVREQRQQRRQQEPQSNSISAVSGEVFVPVELSKEYSLTQATSAPAVKKLVAAILSLHTCSSTPSSQRSDSKKRSAKGSNSSSSSRDFQVVSGVGAPVTLGRSSDLRSRKRKIRTWQQQSNKETTEAAARYEPEAVMYVEAKRNTEAETPRVWPGGGVPKAKGERKEKLQSTSNLFRCIRESASDCVSAEQWQQRQQQRQQQQSQHEHSQRQQQLPQQHQQKRDFLLYEPPRKKLRSVSAAVDDSTIESRASFAKVKSFVGTVREKAGSISARRKSDASTATVAAPCPSAASPASTTTSQVAVAAAELPLKRRLKTTKAQLLQKLLPRGSEDTKKALQEDFTAVGAVLSAECGSEQKKHVKRMLQGEELKEEHLQTPPPLRNAEEQLQQCMIQQGKKQQVLQQQLRQQRVRQSPLPEKEQPQKKQSQQELQQQQQCQHQQQGQQRQHGYGEQEMERPRGSPVEEQCNTCVSEVSRVNSANAGVTAPATKREEVILPVDRKAISCTSMADGSSAAAARRNGDGDRKHDQTPVMGATAFPSGTNSSSSSTSESGGITRNSYSRQSTGVSPSSTKGKKGGAEGNSSRRVSFDLKKNRVAAFHWLQPPCALAPAVSTLESLPANRRSMDGSPRDSSGGAADRAYVMRSNESCVPGCAVKPTKNGTAVGEGACAKHPRDCDMTGRTTAVDPVACNEVGNNLYNTLPSASPSVGASSLHFCASNDAVAAKGIAGISEAATQSVNGGGSAPASCSEPFNKRNEATYARGSAVPRVLKSILKKRQQKCSAAFPPDNTGGSEHPLVVQGGKTEPTDTLKFAIKRRALVSKRPRYRSGKSGPVLALPDGSLYGSSAAATPATVMTEERAASRATTGQTEESG